MLSIRGLVLAYGDEPVLDGVDLDVRSGEFVSLIGPSGSGKSTVLRAITGLQRYRDGRIDLKVRPGELGLLFQDDALLPWRTAEDNVALGLRNHGAGKRDARARARSWLDSVGLHGLADRYPRELSGGQRKRVAIAQVLALRPRLLLMDEPFASLDAIVRHYLTEDLLRWVEGESLTVLLVTHDLEEAVALSDRVALLSSGPRARIKCRYDVELPRPRDLIRAKEHPTFHPLVRRLWESMSEEVASPVSEGRGQLHVVNE